MERIGVRIRKRCVDIERKNMKVTMRERERERSSITLYNSLRSSWEKKVCTQQCTGEE
jgi:hypothetical protein